LFKPHDNTIKILFVLVLGGIFVLICSLPGSQKPGPGSLVGVVAFFAFLMFLAGILGFVALHLARQPNSKNSLVQTLQEMFRSIMGTEEQSNTGQHTDPVSDDDERKVKAAKDRYKRDIRFETDAKLDSEFHTLEEIIRWRKEQRAFVLQDETLTAEEKDELLDRIDVIVEREKRKLRNDGDVYEDE
jgi:hypothetical protein